MTRPLQAHLALGVIVLLVGLGIAVAYWDNDTMEGLMAVVGVGLSIPAAVYAAVALLGLSMRKRAPQLARVVLWLLGVVCVVGAGALGHQALDFGPAGPMAWTPLILGVVVGLGLGAWSISRAATQGRRPAPRG